MADHTITVSNSLNCFGQGPSTKWGANGAGTYTMTWGTSKWGEGTEDILQDVGKLITNSQGFSEPSLRFDLIKVVENSLSGSMDLSSEGLKSGDWSYVFASNTTEGESRTIPSYAEGSAASSSWTQGSSGSVNWS